MGFPKPLSVLPRLFAAFFAKLRGGEDGEDGEETKKTPSSPNKSGVPEACLADAPEEAYAVEEYALTGLTLSGVDTPTATPAHRGSPRRDTETAEAHAEFAETTVPTTTSTSSFFPSTSPAVPWDALPEACVQRVFLHAGVRASLNAGVTCKGWQRVLASNHFWRLTYLAHFGSEDVRARLEEKVSLIKQNSKKKTETPWRAAFVDKTRTNKRWATGSCVCVSSLFDGHGVSQVIGIATDCDDENVLSVGRDGSVVAWSVQSGRKIHEWTQNTTTNVCFAFCKETNVAVVGDTSGVLAAYDVQRSTRLWCSDESGKDSYGGLLLKENKPKVSAAATAVAIGGGAVVVGFANGAIRAYSLFTGHDEHDLTQQGPSSMQQEVTCVAIHSGGEHVAVAAGAEVTTWAMKRNNTFGTGSSTREDTTTSSSTSTTSITSTTSTSAPSTLRWLVGHDDVVRVMRFVGRDVCRGVHCSSTESAYDNVNSGIDSNCPPVLLTAGDDATTRVWCVTSGQLLRELQGPPGTTEAEHAGTVPVAWMCVLGLSPNPASLFCRLSARNYSLALPNTDTSFYNHRHTPAPVITALQVWCGLVVEGRRDGSFLVWVGALEGMGGVTREASNDATSETQVHFQKRITKPASYRRWWAHDDAVTAVVVGEGRVVSTSVDGSAHVLVLSPETLWYASSWRERSGRGAKTKAVVSFAKTDHNKSPPHSPPRRHSVDFFETPAQLSAAARGVAYRAWRGGEFAGAEFAAAARRTAESWHDEIKSAAAVGSGAWRAVDRLSGGRITESAAAADRAWTDCVGVGVQISSAAANAAHTTVRVTSALTVETAAAAERITREVVTSAHSMSRSATQGTYWAFHQIPPTVCLTLHKTEHFSFTTTGLAFFPGFGFGGAGGARGFTFREHAGNGVASVSVTGQLLLTGDVDGNIVVRHFGGVGAMAGTSV